MTFSRFFREPVSGFTHLAGAFCGAVAMVLLTARSWELGKAGYALPFIVFGVSAILLYSSSALYHLLDISEAHRLFFRKLDHTMIFVLIAGTYTPICLIPLRHGYGPALLAVIWAIAFLGVLSKLFWPHAPRRLSTLLYLVMGWLIAIAIPPLSRTMGSSALLWLIAGGLFYTVGAVIYAVKWPDPFPPHFGFHEIWHLFVLAGTSSHFACMWAMLE